MSAISPSTSKPLVEEIPVVSQTYQDIRIDEVEIVEDSFANTELVPDRLPKIVANGAELDIKTLPPISMTPTNLSPSTNATNGRVIRSEPPAREISNVGYSDIPLRVENPVREIVNIPKEPDKSIVPSNASIIPSKIRDPSSKPIKGKRPDYSKMSMSLLSKYRVDLLTRVNRLRLSHKHFNIPLYPHDIDVDVLHNYYDRYVKEALIEGSVDKYEMLLIISWLVIELGFSKILQWDGFKGFTTKQYGDIATYKCYLEEIAERGGASIIASLPAEIRLMLVILFNAAVYAAMYYLTKYAGSDFSRVAEQAVRGLVAPQEAIIGPDGTAEVPVTAGPSGMIANILNNIPGGLSGVMSVLQGLAGGNNQNQATNQQAAPAAPPRASRRPPFDG